MPGRFLFFDPTATVPPSSRTRLRGKGLREALRGENGVARFLGTRGDPHHPDPHPLSPNSALFDAAVHGGRLVAVFSAVRSDTPTVVLAAPQNPLAPCGRSVCKPIAVARHKGDCAWARTV